jgi:hypothetical protein
MLLLPPVHLLNTLKHINSLHEIIISHWLGESFKFNSFNINKKKG